MSNNVDKFKDMLKPKEKETVYDHLIDTPEDNDNNDANINDSVNDSVDVNLTSIPIAKQKKSIRETHKTKAFYIRNDLAKLIDKDIKTSRRGAMTEIVNALFEEYYRSQGRLK